jgi:transcriptional regulator with XRE-family HTH domain
VDETLRRLGRGLAPARRRRRLRQSDVSERIGLSRSAYSRMERGLASGAPIADWVAAALALGLTPRFELGRDPLEETPGEGHLAIQELLLRLGRGGGYTGSFELGVRPDTRHSIDVALRDPRRRLLLVVEAWNTFGDVAAAARSFQRKLAAAGEIASWLDGGGYSVHGAWVVRASRRNRALVSRIPGVFAATCPGSSRHWVAALTSGAAPPSEPGLVWCDLPATRLFDWRR